MKSGRNYAFVGANGTGKTTITKLLTGLYKNYTGSIYINGKEPKRVFAPAYSRVFLGTVSGLCKISGRQRRTTCI